MTFSRRPGARFNRGRVVASVVAAAASPTPATILGANCTAWWRADAGDITIATGVSQWLDKTASRVLSNGTGASQPTYSASGGPNSKPCVQFDGSNDFLDGPVFARSHPQTIWLIVKQNSWTANESIINDASATFIILQRTASPQLAQSCGTGANNNAAAALGSFARVQAEFTNSVADRLLIVANSITGTNSGSTAGTQLLVGRNAASTTFGHFDLCEIVLSNITPSAQQTLDLSAYCASYYGAGLV